MAEKTVVLQDGRVEPIGSPRDLHDQVVKAVVASVIGSPSMNLRPGRVVRDGAGPGIALAGAGLPVPLAAPLAEGREILVGIRPEHLNLSDSGLPAEIAVVEPTGSETHVVSRLAGQPEGKGRDRAGEIVAVFRDRHPLRPGQAIRLAPDPARLHLFDATSGVRLD